MFLLLCEYQSVLLTRSLSVQPENPAEFGGRVYEMMGMALAGRRSAREEQSGSAAPEVTTEESSPEESEPQSEVVEASEVITENDPWK